MTAAGSEGPGGRHRAPVVVQPPPHPSWWTRRRRAAAGAAALSVVIVAALAVAPNPDIPTGQLYTAEQPQEPTGRGSTPVRPQTDYPPVDIPVIGADGAYGPDPAERTTPDCGRCENRTDPPATAAPAEPGTPPARDDDPDASSDPTEEEAGPAAGITLGLLELVNRDRIANGCGPVTLHPSLMSQSQAHADAQAADDTMYHSAGVTGFGAWGENVAFGYDTATAVHDAWMNSPGHRANILNCDYTFLGYGATSGPSGRYWTEQLAA